MDKYIVLTHQQMKDIQEMYPIENERFELIPHFIELNHRKGEMKLYKKIVSFISVDLVVKTNGSFN